MSLKHTAVKIGKLDGVGTVYRAVGSLDEQITAFQARGIKYPFFASAEEVARIWHSGLSNNWSRINLAVVRYEDNPPILYRDSPFMTPDIAKFTSALYAEDKRIMHPISLFFATSEGILVDKNFYAALEKIVENEKGALPEDRTVQLLNTDDSKEITSEMEESRFLLGKFNKDYFDNWSRLHVYTPTEKQVSEGMAGVFPMWFDIEGDMGFGMYPWGGTNDGDGGAFAILRNGEKKR